MSTAQAPRSRWRRLGAAAVLALGASAVVALVAPAVPRDQAIVLGLGSEPPVLRVDASFTLEGESEPRIGFTRRFPEPPPPSLRHAVSLPNGRYVVAVTVTRGSATAAPRETSYVRRVTLDGGEALLALQDSP